MKLIVRKALRIVGLSGVVFGLAILLWLAMGFVAGLVT